MNQVKWYVLRDLRRRNSNTPGYAELAARGFEVFTPLRWEIAVRGGRRVRRQVPVIAGPAVRPLRQGKPRRRP